jgi:hypothetical protein
METHSIPTQYIACLFMPSRKYKTLGGFATEFKFVQGRAMGVSMYQTQTIELNQDCCDGSLVHIHNLLAFAAFVKKTP